MTKISAIFLFLILSSCSIFHVLTSSNPYPKTKVKEEFYRKVSGEEFFIDLSLSEKVETVVNDLTRLIKNNKEFIPLSNTNESLNSLELSFSTQYQRLLLIKTDYLKDVNKSVDDLKAKRYQGDFKSFEATRIAVLNSEVVATQDVYLEAIGLMSYLYALIAYKDSQTDPQAIYKYDWSDLKALALITHSRISKMSQSRALSTGEIAKTLTPAPMITPSLADNDSGFFRKLNIYSYSPNAFSRGDGLMIAHFNEMKKASEKFQKGGIKSYMDQLIYSDDLYSPDLKIMHIAFDELVAYEMSVLKEPKDALGFARLNQFLGTREVLINSWAYERLTQKKSQEIKDCVKGSLSFKNSGDNKKSSDLLLKQDLWRSDKYFNHAPEVFRKAKNVVLEDFLGSSLSLDYQARSKQAQYLAFKHEEAELDDFAKAHANYIALFVKMIYDYEKLPRALQENLLAHPNFSLLVEDDLPPSFELITSVLFHSGAIDDMKKFEYTELELFNLKEFSDIFNYYDDLTPESIARTLVEQSYSHRKQGIINWFIEDIIYGEKLSKAQYIEIENYLSTQIDYFAIHWANKTYEKTFKLVMNSTKDLLKKNYNEKISNIHEYVNYPFVIESLRVINDFEKGEPKWERKVPMSSSEIFKQAFFGVLKNGTNEEQYMLTRFGKGLDLDEVSTEFFKSLDEKFNEYKITTFKSKESYKNINEEVKQARVWKDFLSIIWKKYRELKIEKPVKQLQTENVIENFQGVARESTAVEQNQKITEIIEIPIYKKENKDFISLRKSKSFAKVPFELRTKDLTVNQEELNGCEFDFLNLVDTCKEVEYKKIYLNGYKDSDFVLKLMDVFGLTHDDMAMNLSEFEYMGTKRLGNPALQYALANVWIKKLEQLEPYLKTLFVEQREAIKSNIFLDYLLPPGRSRFAGYAWANVINKKLGESLWKKHVSFSTMLSRNLPKLNQSVVNNFSKNKIKSLFDKSLNETSLSYDEENHEKVFCEADYYNYDSDKNFKEMYLSTSNIRESLVKDDKKKIEINNKLKKGVTPFRYYYRKFQEKFVYFFFAFIIIGTILSAGAGTPVLIGLTQAFAFTLSFEAMFLTMDFYDLHYALVEVPARVNIQTKLMNGSFLRKTNNYHPLEYYSLDTVERLDKYTEEFKTEVKFIAGFSPLTFGGLRHVARSAKFTLASPQVKFLARKLKIPEVIDYESNVKRLRKKRSKLRNILSDTKNLFFRLDGKTALPITRENLKNIVFHSVKYSLKNIDQLRKKLAGNSELGKIGSSKEAFSLFLQEQNLKLDVLMAKAYKKKNVKFNYLIIPNREVRNVDHQKLIKLGQRVLESIEKKKFSRSERQLLRGFSETLDSISKLSKTSKRKINKPNLYKNIDESHADKYTRDLASYVQMMSKIESKFAKSLNSQSKGYFKKFNNMLEGDRYENLSNIVKAKRLCIDYAKNINSGKFDHMSFDDVYSKWMSELSKLPKLSKDSIERVITKRSLKEMTFENLLTIRLSRNMNSVSNALFDDVYKAIDIKETIKSKEVKRLKKSLTKNFAKSILNAVRSRFRDS